MTNPEIGMLQLGLFIFVILLGFPIAFTLMACYGAAPPPPCPDGTRNCLQKTDDPPPSTSAGPEGTGTSESPATTPSGADGGQ